MAAATAATTGASLQTQHHLHHQLPGMRGDGGGFFGPSHSSSQSFMAPMEVDGSDIATAVIGDGGQASEKPSLYDYLADLFGERLSLRLSGHQKFATQPPSTVAKKPSDTQPASKITNPEEKMGRKIAPPPSDDKLLGFLKREGFKSIRVDTHMRIPPPRASQHPYQFSPGFSLPRTVLPVQSNVLEGRPSRKKKKKTSHSRAKTDAVTLERFRGRVFSEDNPSRSGCRGGRVKAGNNEIQVSDIWL